MEESEDTLRAIRAGEVDALVVSGPEGEQVYTLQGADYVYRILLETMQEGALTLGSDGTILYCNRRLADLLRLPLQKVIGSSFKSLFSDGSGEVLREMFKHGEGETGRRELFLNTADGERVPVLLSFGTMNLRDLKANCVTVTELTEQKKAEDELRRANAELRGEMDRREKAEQQLRQAQKMEAVGTLAGGIAHDFNNMLASIVISSEMALFDIEDCPHIRKHVDLILKAGLRGKDLVRQLMLFSRKTEQRREVITLTPIIKESFKLLRSSVPTTVQIKLHLLTEADTAFADAGEIQQVIMNLCTNAADAMEGKTGEIDLSLESVTLAPADLPDPEMRKGDYLVITVKDTGIGMKEEVRKRIFEPFFTTKPTGKGTGLGLSVVYGIVKSHDGNITVSSEPGKGSIFKVYLPKVDTAGAEEGKSPHSIPRGNERILVVDDEEFIVNSVQTMLRRLGYKVTGVTDSREAMKLFSANPSQFDLVMTDQTMPFTTGEDLGKEMMRIRPDIPVVLCTGYADFISPEKAAALGFRGFITKPFTLREGAEIVRHSLDQAAQKTGKKGAH